MLWSAVALEGVTTAVIVQVLGLMPPLTPQLPSNTQERVTADNRRVLPMQSSPRYGSCLRFFVLRRTVFRHRRSRLAF